MKTMTTKQFATKHNLTPLDSRAVLAFLAGMAAIAVTGGVDKKPGEKGRKERIYGIPESITLDMTGKMNKDLLKIPEVAVAPKAPKAKKVAKAKPAPKAKKAKKSKSAPVEAPAASSAPVETPAPATETNATETASAEAAAVLA